jgi:methylthioribulose-1-phosphate dehydratase
MGSGDERKFQRRRFSRSAAAGYYLHGTRQRQSRARTLYRDGRGFEDYPRKGRPSAEALLHLAIVRGREAGAVLHTHSVWSTVLSGAHASKGGVALEGYEMLKGLEGVRTHQHREWLPILENSQDMGELSQAVSKTLSEHPAIHGFLLREHGLYTWGASLQEAKRHVEILEFLIEVAVRSRDVARSS